MNAISVVTVLIFMSHKGLNYLNLLVFSILNSRSLSMKVGTSKYLTFSSPINPTFANNIPSMCSTVNILLEIILTSKT